MQDLTVRVSPSFGYRSTRRSSASETCFAPPAPDSAGLVIRVDATVPTYVVGGADLLSNDQVTAADNAAVALRILGQHERLVWFVPDPRDVAAGEAGSVAGQLPQALEPAAYLLAVALLATMIWRGRRLGPLVTEPLPVTVKAVESTQGRGRLYRRTRDRPHAADVLRAATTRRLASRLRLPAGASASLVGSAAATAVDEDPAAVDDVLVSRVITDDAALTRLAQDLAALERKVHRP